MASKQCGQISKRCCPQGPCSSDGSPPLPSVRRSAAKQQAAGDGECARVSFGDVDKLIYNTSLPHFQLELLGVQRVRLRRIPPARPLAMHVLAACRGCLQHKSMGRAACSALECRTVCAFSLHLQPVLRAPASGPMAAP